MKLYFDLGSIYALLYVLNTPLNNEGWYPMTNTFGHYFRDYDPRKMIPFEELPNEDGPTSAEVLAWKDNLELKKL